MIIFRVNPGQLAAILILFLQFFQNRTLLCVLFVLIQPLAAIQINHHMLK